MSREFTEFHKDALDEVTAFLGSQFTYNNCVYTGIISVMELSTELKEGGLLEVFTTQVIVSKTQLPIVPTAGQTLYIGTQQCRIIRVGSDEVSYELNCITASV